MRYIVSSGQGVTNLRTENFTSIKFIHKRTLLFAHLVGASQNRYRKESSDDCWTIPAVRKPFTAQVDRIRRPNDQSIQGLGQRVSEPLPVGLALIAFLSIFHADAAQAAIHTEPANALSVPTWIIHISSVIEWAVAMMLMWRYAEVTGNEKWKGMTWGMMPLFAGALCACTYHFFYNSPELDILVAIQASLTWIGNATLWLAAYRIYKDGETASTS